MIAVVVCRDGQLPTGALETVAECDGLVVLVGTGTRVAADELHGYASHVTTVDTRPFAAAHYRDVLIPLVSQHDVVVLPASADGRDLAPRLSAALHRPLYANAIRVEPHRVDTVVGSSVGSGEHGGAFTRRSTPGTPFVATLLPGVRGALPTVDGPPAHVDQPAPSSHTVDPTAQRDATSLELIGPDVDTIDLAEATRIVGGGAGLDGAPRFAQLAEIGRHLGASVGATRVITDRRWVDHRRQIGTTGVVVAPRLYLAFGISGAVQHTAGLGSPDHIISVNTDPHCPMMQMADLAVVADANAVIDALADALAGTQP